MKLKSPFNSKGELKRPSNDRFFRPPKDNKITHCTMCGSKLDKIEMRSLTYLCTQCELEQHSDE